MKKIIVMLLTLVITIVSFSLCASAADLADGTYEVPVTLMHKEDEEESFGNKYVASVALLEVENEKKTITIFLTTDMNGIEFSYYTNGSLEGEVAQATSVSDITASGETYKRGFEIPVMSDGDIGLKFSVPVMPMSPSARLRIDYDNAVLVSSDKTASDETTTASVTAQVETTEPTTQITTKPETTTEIYTTVAATEVVYAPVTQETTVYVTEAVAESPEKKENDTPSAIFVILFIGATVALTLLSTSDLKESKNDDD